MYINLIAANGKGALLLCIGLSENLAFSEAGGVREFTIYMGVFSKLFLYFEEASELCYAFDCSSTDSK